MQQDLPEADAQNQSSARVDWISSFLSYTDGMPSPEIFRLWSAISAVGGALERRVWVRTARSSLYPNLFTLLVAPPGIGKSQAINPVADVWRGCKKLKVAPDNVTKAALIDALSEANNKVSLPSGILEYHALLVACSELGVFLPAHDLEFLSVLNDIYDNRPSYTENRRSLSKQIAIKNPQLTILAGTQPGFLANLLPDEAWSMGFTSRIIMIYSGETPEIDLWADSAGQDKEFERMVIGLRPAERLYGAFGWEPEAQHKMTQFNFNRRASEPEHSKLLHYNSRRTIHVLKLSQIAAVSSRMEMVIRACDVDRAIDWLLAAEAVMPDIFREMKRKSDTDVISELHFFMWRIYVKEKKPIHEARLFNFLREHIPSDKILRLLDIAQKSNIVQRVAGTENLYVPRAKHEHGLE